MVHSELSRRRLLAGIGGLGAAALLGGCATSSSDSGSGSSATLTLQSSLSDPSPKAALTKVVEGYTKTKVTLNTIAIETFRAQLPTYLNSATPPDVLTWYAGSVARDYASKGFLLGRTGAKNYLVADDFQHVLLFAPTGSGKGVGFVIPNLLFWEESIVCHDIKLENYELTSGYRNKSLGQECYVWNPADPDGRTHCYNPLDWISE